MSIYGYEIKNSFDFFKKLLDEREDYLKDPASSRFALNVALTAWHLHEWIFEEYKNLFISQGLLKLEDFRNFLFQRCRELENFRDLADGSKHFTLTRRDSTILKTELREADSHWGFNKKLETPTLIVVTTPASIGMQITFDDLLYVVSFFWYSFFRSELSLKQEADALMQTYTFF